MVCTACYLILKLRTTCPKVALPTYARPSHIHGLTHRPIWWRIFLSWGFSLLRWPGLVSSLKKKKNKKHWPAHSPNLWLISLCQATIEMQAEAASRVHNQTKSFRQSLPSYTLSDFLAYLCGTEIQGWPEFPLVPSWVCINMRKGYVGVLLINTTNKVTWSQI